MRYLFVAAGRLWRWLEVAPTGKHETAGHLCRADRWARCRRVAVHPVSPQHDRRGRHARVASLVIRRGRHLAPAARCLTHADSCRIFAALLLLDASVTFRNWWPTPAVRWFGEPSVELACLLLVLAWAVGSGRINTASRRLLRWLSAGWLLLILGRYVDVTAPALWGRELNFYWDLRFLPDVAAMLVGASRNAALVGTMVAAVVVLVIWALYLAVRWAFRQTLRRTGRADAGTSARLAGHRSASRCSRSSRRDCFGRDYLGDARRLFPRPVTQVYARQARLIVQAMSDGTHLAPSPALDANLDAGAGRGCLPVLHRVVRRGRRSSDPSSTTRLQQPRALFDRRHSRHRPRRRLRIRRIADLRRIVLVRAHLVPVGHQGRRILTPNALLMTEQRPTVVTNFARRGYRTLAMMPGLWYPWPEGAFYGFQDIYNGPKLDYQGPSFGWWDMPDQFTLAKLDEQEVSKAVASAAVRVLPDRQHAHAVQPAGAVSAGLGEDADAAALH